MSGLIGTMSLNTVFFLKASLTKNILLVDIRRDYISLTLLIWARYLE